MGRLTRADIAAVLITLPVVALGVWWLVMLAFAFVTVHPIWDVRPQNLAEAAAFRDGAAIARRVRAGEDPTVPAEVRPGVIASTPLRLTPFEVAARERREEILRLLNDLGASPTVAAWTRAWCQTDDANIRTALLRFRPQGAGTGCGENNAQP
jgi:hypothetical protein